MDNRNKTDKVDESILEETPPNINEPQTTQDNPENQDPNPEPETPPADSTTPTDETPEVTPETPQEGTEEEVPADAPAPETPVTPVVEETEEQKKQRYNAQQSEAQVQKARSDTIISKVEQANQIPDPTVDQMRAFVASDGVSWDELTPLEQSTQKRLWKSEQRDKLLTEAVQTTKDIDAFATKVDDFIDATDGKPEFVKLSGHEAEFRRYAMLEAHRGTPINVLLNAFLFTLPAPVKKRGSLFEKGGGGDAQPKPGKITDVDQAASLRTTNPREYKRLVKEGKIDLEA